MYSSSYSWPPSSRHSSRRSYSSCLPAFNYSVVLTWLNLLSLSLSWRCMIFLYSFEFSFSSNRFFSSRFCINYFLRFRDSLADFLFSSNLLLLASSRWPIVGFLPRVLPVPFYKCLAEGSSSAISKPPSSASLPSLDTSSQRFDFSEAASSLITLIFSFCLVYCLYLRFWDLSC